MSFPNFPEFRKVAITDEDEYLHYYSQLRDPNSDFSFHNLIIWLDYYSDLEASVLNNNVVLKFTDIIKGDSFCYSLVGISHLEKTINELLTHLTTQSDNPKLSYATEQIMDAAVRLNRPDIRIEEDIDNNDYVYNVDDLVAMQGSMHRNLREKVKKFERNKNIQTRLLDCKNDDDKKAIISAVTAWSVREETHRNDPLKTELSTIKKYIDLAQTLSVFAYGIYVDNKLVCISIAHYPPQKGWLIGEHLKYDNDYSEAFRYAVHETARIAQYQGIKWLNCEQDLGLEGIRSMKMSLRPARFLRCYTISLSLISQEPIVHL
jgi:hypothetical protein